VTLLDDTEDAFWARFYEPVQRERLRLGERTLETEAWRRPTADLIAILTPYWADRMGPRPRPARAPRRDAGAACRSTAPLPRRPRSTAPRWRGSTPRQW